MRIDLHSHSTASDGTEPPPLVVRRAHAAGVDVLALTDHDTVAGMPAAAGALVTGLTLVSGAEISCVLGGVSLHLLGYLFDPHEPGLARELDLLRTDRVRRGRAMVQRCAELGAPINWERVAAIAGDGSVGRPHVARALVECGAVDSVDDAFTPDWISDDGRAYVAKHALDAEHAIRLVRGAGGVSVLAHPAANRRAPTVDDDAVAAMAAAGLGGLEVDHPDHDPAARSRLRGLAADLALTVTGSSDDHGELTGHRLGCETTAEAAYEELIAGAHGAQPLTAGTAA